jgi:flavin reductase (DIM6/NTAB) family NADH-FMN oxidoreductase RutF
MHQTITPKILYFGTPIVLISTLNEDGSANIAPMSSAWALGWTILLGLDASSQTTQNLSRTGECVLNLPSEDLVPQVERLAILTGMNPVPPHKLARQMRYEPDKFRASGFTAEPSSQVSPPSIQECPLRLEARLHDMRAIARDDAHIASTTGVVAAEVRVLQVNAHKEIIADRDRINARAWRPLIYNFRHYFGLGTEIQASVSVNFR